MRSAFYYEGHCRKVAANIKEHINSSPDFLSPLTAGSPRAVGDAIESLVAEKFDVFPGAWCREYSNDFARRAMADPAFGALGWGRIQISNSSNIRVIDGYSRKKWMLRPCRTMLEFYPGEILKIKDRMDRFSTVMEYWERKDDIWT